MPPLDVDAMKLCTKKETIAKFPKISGGPMMNVGTSQKIPILEIDYAISTPKYAISTFKMEIHGDSISEKLEIEY